MDNKEKEDFGNEITETRKLVVTREHAALLVWGITASAIGMFIYLLQYLTHDSYGWVWAFVPVIACPVQWYLDRKRPHAKFTPLYVALGRIGVISTILVGITALLTIPYNFNAYFVIMLILSIWCGLSGFMLDYARLWQLAIGGLVLAIALFIKAPDPYELPVFVVGLCVTLIAPGLDMIRRQKSNDFYKY